MIKFWTISKNTFVQTIRQPVYGILIAVTFAILLASLPLSGWTMATNYKVSDQKQLESLCLATLLVSGLLVAAFSASSVLTREIEDRTALTVIAKPISRATFVLGKFGGVAAAVAAAFYLCSLAMLMIVRHHVISARIDPFDWPVIVLGISALVLTIVAAVAGNYFFGWPFVSSAVWAALILMSIAMGVLVFVGKGWQIVPPGYDTPERLVLHPQLLVGLALIFMAVLVFVAVAVTASTRLSQVMTLLVCIAVFVIGAIHPALFGRWAKDIFAARLLGWIAPNLTFFFPLDALIKDKAYPVSYLAKAAGYCGLYVAGVLAFGMALFERRQLEAQGASSSMPGAVALVAWAGRVGALVLVLTALVAASLPAYHHAAAFIAMGGMVLAAAVLWALASGFGRGAKWGFWLTGVAAVAGLLTGLAVSFLPRQLGFSEFGPSRVIGLAGVLVAAAVLAIMSMPKTRRHFQ